jgi:AcrR family transcriptional regulator
MTKEKKQASIKSRARPAAGSAERILRAALAEFAEFGLAGARVDHIAARSGVNKAMIYYHFGSKEKLYDETIKQVMTGLTEFLKETAAGESDPEEFVRKVAAYYHSMFEKLGDFRPIFLRELASGGGRLSTLLPAAISERGLQKKMKSLIDRGKKTGTLRNVDSVQAIVSFIGMNIFYLMAAPIVNSIWGIKDEKRFRNKRQTEVADLFLYGLKAR